MSKPSLKKKYGATRGKFIAVAVLLIVFVGVLISQFCGSGPSQPEANKAAASDKTAETKRPNTQSRIPKKRQSPGAVTEAKTTNVAGSEIPAQIRTAQPAATKQDVAKTEGATWPSVSLSSVTRHDPFALPVKVKQDMETRLQNQRLKEALAKQAALDEQRAAVMRFAKTLQQAGVDMVLINANERVARIGTKTVRVGDVINGLRIKEIRDDAVIVVEPLIPVGER